MTKQQHGQALHRMGKFLGFARCPHCDGIGGMWQAWDSGAVGFDRWCYICGYKTVVERRQDVEARRVQIWTNARRIAELEKELAALKEA